MSKLFEANILNRLFAYKIKKKENMAGPQLLLPQSRTRLCYQQYFNYRGWSTNYHGPSMAALMQ
jgi:hypothetical protein